MAPGLTFIAVLSLGAGILSSGIILMDILRGQRQKMWIMNVIWPITALYSGPLGLVGYFTVGRQASLSSMQHAKQRGQRLPNESKPFWQTVGVATTHCGSGCTLGDLVAEWLTYAAPVVIFGKPIFGTWIIDFAFAFLFGIAFQYYTIKPMRKLSAKEGIHAALKADTLSLLFWQLGMYGWMAIVTFVIFGHPLKKTDPVFWFMMQIAMLIGFLTSYPINWWLLKNGIKEPM